MSDLKSKLPDLKELGDMTCKLFKDLKNSVKEIITGYKKKHPTTTEHMHTAKPSPVKKAAPKTTAEKEKPVKKPKAAPKATTTTKK